jgi:hypothetical protein
MPTCQDSAREYILLPQHPGNGHPQGDLIVINEQLIASMHVAMWDLA